MSHPAPLRRLTLSLGLAALVAGVLFAAPAQQPDWFPVDEVRPGMVGIGRTVFAGDTIEEFQAQILGVLRSVTGPQQDLILARLSGGPLASTGVISGMSGSPVYINGRLLGAVSYALGSFPKEPMAGITPIREMTQATSSAASPASIGRAASDLTLSWPATPDAVYGALERLARRASAPLGAPMTGRRVQGPASLSELGPMLRPIGVAMAMSGFDPSVERDLRRALNVPAAANPGPGASPAEAAAAQQSAPAADRPLRPGDPVGMALVRGDYNAGATGTVTHVDGARVFAFGHAFLNLGPSSMAMTRAQIFGVIPSLDSSMKIAALDKVIGTMTQDRPTGVAGNLGAGPPELDVTVTLRSERAPERQLRFQVLHDQALTPLFAYVAVLNALATYERQSGPLTIAATGSVSFGANGTVAIDDWFSGDGASVAAAAAITSAVGMAATNEFRPALADRLSVTLTVSERQDTSTIERVWLDTTRPKAGETRTLSVLLRHYRGGTETVTMPVTLPTQAPGPITLLVGDAPALSAIEERDLRPGRPSTWPALLDKMNRVPRNNRIYVRLLSSSTGTVVAGEALPALPASVRSVLDEDKTVATASVTRTVLGAWEHRLNRVVRGSRELTLTLSRD